MITRPTFVRDIVAQGFAERRAQWKEKRAQKRTLYSRRKRLKTARKTIRRPAPGCDSEEHF